MLDYGFWNDPEVEAARAEVIAAAEAFEAGTGDEPALERAVILFNEVVMQVRTRLGHYAHEKGDVCRLTEEQHRMVLDCRLEDAKVAPPQTAELVEVRMRLLEAVSDLDKPLANWEREFIMNTACMRYRSATRWARKPLPRKGDGGWEKSLPKSSTNTWVASRNATS